MKDHGMTRLCQLFCDGKAKALPCTCHQYGFGI